MSGTMGAAIGTQCCVARNRQSQQLLLYASSDDKAALGARSPSRFSGGSLPSRPGLSAGGTSPNQAECRPSQGDLRLPRGQRQPRSIERRSKTMPVARGRASRLLDLYTLGRVLGQGAYGIVYACKKRGSGEEYAVKMIDKVETPLNEIEHEAEMLRRLAHRTVVRLHAVFYEKTFVCMVMDSYAGGACIDGMQLYWEQHGMLPKPVVKSVSNQMIGSIAWLHQNNVVHRDVKGDNYLMDRPDIGDLECRIYLSDFGTVCELPEGDRLRSQCGTKTYWAPELFAGSYGLKVDVWALGVIFFGLLTGKFPFRGEQDVKCKALRIPDRAGQVCGELLEKLLEKREAERLSASEALTHHYYSICETPSLGQHPQRFTSKPDVKEQGAHAGLDARRRELVERLQHAHGGDRQPKLLKAQELCERNRYDVVMNQGEKKATLEWFSKARADEFSLHDMQGARRWEDNESHDDTAADIRRMFEEHKIDTAGFGRGQAKTLEEFVNEVQSGASRLMLDATRHKELIRVVDLVLLRISHTAEDGTMRYLIKTKEQFPDGRARHNINQLPGVKKKPHESSLETLRNLVRERLQLAALQIKVDMSSKEQFEEDTDSASFPGMRTVYRAEVFEGTVTATDRKVLEEAGALDSGRRSGHEVTATDAKAYDRTYEWLTEEECEDREIKLKIVQDCQDFSALVHAPVGIPGEEELHDFLAANGVDAAKFDAGLFKTLSDQIVRGESTLVQCGGKFLRRVDVVVVRLMRGDEVLAEAEEVLRGTRNVLNRLPAVKRRPDENVFVAAHRCLKKHMGICENAVSFNAETVMIAEEQKDSKGFPGLPSLYRKRIITATLVKEEASLIIT